MKFGEVVGRATYGATGFLAEAGDLGRLEAVILHNLPVLAQFREVLVATTYADRDREALSAANERLWRSYLPDVVLIDSIANRGHSIGTADLDNILFDACKASDTQWLCKSAIDVLLDELVLAIDVEEAQFYFLNAVSYDALAQHDLDLTPFTEGFFFPQTTFYAIDVTATDYLVDKAFLDRSWETVQRIPSYNGRIWEYLPGWSCENLLRLCVLRNELTTAHLITDEQWREVLRVIIDQRMTDCSFKGLSINGICHTHGGPALIQTVVP